MSPLQSSSHPSTVRGRALSLSRSVGVAAGLLAALSLAACGEDSDDVEQVLLPGSPGPTTPADAGAPAEEEENDDTASGSVDVPLFPTSGIGALSTPVQCEASANAGDPADGDLNVDLGTVYQRITGFGGISSHFGVPTVTAEQVDTAFGTGPGQIGLTVLRLPIVPDPAQFGTELETAQRAAELGALIFGSPWSPPPALKTNGNVVGGELDPANYGAYADHLMAYRQFMADNGVPIRAISVQNEPDIDFFRPEGPISYDGCQWMPEQIGAFLTEQGPRFGNTAIIAPESFNFNRDWSDPLLNDDAIAAQFEIVGGHIYGNGLFDYPLAREKQKEVWMTEHYTDSGSEPGLADQWPLAYNVARELHDSMEANFNAYVWWYIRRVYGFMFDDGTVSKRGYLMSQFSRFVRPGFERVAVSEPGVENVRATAYKNGPGQVVVVVLNENETEQAIDLDVFGSCVTAFDRYTTSETKNVVDDGPVSLVDGRVNVTLDALSVTTFVSQPIE